MVKIFRFVLMILLVCPTMIHAQELKPIKLLSPRIYRGRPLMQALKDRMSKREFSPQALSLQTLSDLLWAAFGINRPESGGRTAPSAMNMQEIDIYVAKADGLYLFDAKENLLRPIIGEDIRELTGKQPFVKDAPVNLIYVADISKMKGVEIGAIDALAGLDTGFIGENVYLYCASEGLATVVRGWVDKKTLAVTMKLRPNQSIVLTQSVGHPKNEKAY